MNKLFSVLVMIAVGGICYVLFSAFLSPDEVSEPVFVDFTTTEPKTDTEVMAENTMQTRLRTGEVVSVTNLQTDRYDLGDGDTYVVTGGLNEVDPAYAITYFASYDFYQISLNQEPLAEVRKTAEAELQTTLGVDNATLCGLEVSVRTKVDVSQFFAGQELGISFCPGSVALE